MILSEKQEKTLNDLDMLKKKIELLDSHRAVMPELVSDKQYYDSLRTISDEVAKIEIEYGIKPQTNSINDKLKACFDTVEEIGQMLEYMLKKSEPDNDASLNALFNDMVVGGFSEEEIYDTLVHKAIEDIKNVN